MPFALTTATKKIARLKKRIKCIQGGTSASKTISILLILISKAQTDYSCDACGRRGCGDRAHSEKWRTNPKLTSVISESFPHLKKGAIRDFKNIMIAQGYWKDDRWNASDYIYTFETGSQIEFFSADNAGKVRGPRRDRAFLNECNNIKNGLEVFNQIEVRTREEIYLDWNPDREFWVYTDILTNEAMDVDHLIITYLDNEALEESIVHSIESRRGNKSWWRVYGEGLLGEVEGRIYTGWQLDLTEVPHEARLERYGIDFGYSQDPTAIVAVYYYNGGYILDEILHRKGMSNKQIADVLNNLPYALAIADSAEPKSIDELREYGVQVLPATKGAGSVTQGISWVQDQRISLTARSINIRKSYNNYLWARDKDGEYIRDAHGHTVPDHYLSDPMDALRYGMSSLRPRIEEEDEEFTSAVVTGNYF